MLIFAGSSTLLLPHPHPNITSDMLTLQCLFEKLKYSYNYVKETGCRAKIRNSIMGDTHSVCSWLSCHHPLSHFSPPINPIKKCLVPIIKFVCTLKFACVCTHGSKKTFCYLSSDQSPSGNCLCRPSAASQEAQPSSTRYYDLFIKMNR